LTCGYANLAFQAIRQEILVMQQTLAPINTNQCTANKLKKAFGKSDTVCYLFMKKTKTP
jgi:hypothetical protein